MIHVRWIKPRNSSISCAESEKSIYLDFIVVAVRCCATVFLHFGFFHPLIIAIIQLIALNHNKLSWYEIICHKFFGPRWIMALKAHKIDLKLVNMSLGENWLRKDKEINAYVRANWIETSSRTSPTVAISSVFHSPFGCDTSVSAKKKKNKTFNGKSFTLKMDL